MKSDLLDIRGEFCVETGSEFGFVIWGIPVTYDVMSERIVCLNRSAPLRLKDGKVRMQILVDKMSIEIFGNNGATVLSVGAIFDRSCSLLEAYSKGGRTKVNFLEIHELNSVR